VQTYVARHTRLDVSSVASAYADLERRAAQALDAEGFARDRHRYARSADLRYFGQAYEVRVPVPAGPVSPDLAEAVVAAFHDAHEALYGYAFRDRPEQQVEWVNLRVTGIGPIDRPQLRPLDAFAPGTGVVSARDVCFENVYVDTTIYQRSALPPGAVVRGPAIIEEYGSTVPIHPGYTATVDPYGNLVVTRG
jgi:N-methylhydantoinase A